MSVEKRSQFGSRFLTHPEKVFEHNAWDNVVWDEEQEAIAELKVEANSEEKVSDECLRDYEENACGYWDQFYGQHQNRFFKDRHWLFTEFPELCPEVSGSASNEVQCKATVSDATLKSDGSSDERVLPAENVSLSSSTVTCFSLASECNDTTTRILEVGCGVGNTVFPVLQTNNDPGLFVYCCDFSQTAIELVKSHADYDPSRCCAFVHDVCDEDQQFPFPEDHLDIVILIFVLSAIDPRKMQGVINKLARHLKPGGQILLRDYGRYDMAQLRFKKGKCLADNFYVRGDGTRCYFFTQDELRQLFLSAGLTEEQNLTDRRLQVNRGRQLKMYRVWIQCKYRKPL